MKNLKDYKNEINKCSKCGLCETVCPLFKINPNDCVASKGKFIMLNGVVNGDLQLSATVNKYIDMCLKCGKCKKFCPSGIDLCEILSVAKFEYMKNKFLWKCINLFQSRKVFNSLINLGYFFSKPFRKKYNCSNSADLKVIYFKGCVNNLFPNNDRYLRKILQGVPVKILEADFECCGLPFLSEGNIPRFLEVCEHNLKIFDKLEYDYIVTDCASCKSTIESYSNYSNAGDLSNSRNIDWGDLIASQNLRFKFPKNITVTFHKPCHLNNDYFWTQIINNCENVKYVKMNDYDTCCGLAGSFALKNINLSNKLGEEKAKNIIKTKADYVVTTCPACIIGLKKCLFGTNIKVVGLLEFLSMANRI